MTHCSAPLCQRPVLARGWCATHYQAARRHGGELPEPRERPDIDGRPLLLRLSTVLRRLSEVAAKSEGVGLSTWWRKAGEERVLRQEAQRRKLSR